MLSYLNSLLRKRSMRYPISIIIVLFILSSCVEEKENTFLISRESVGKLKRHEAVANLSKVYEGDSVVNDSARFQGSLQSRTIHIFEKGGAQLLTFTTSEDSIPKIANIRIHDPRYTTENGITLKSTFKDIKDKLPIGKIVTSRNNVIIFIQKSDVYFTISKEELPASLRYVGSTNIEAVQIPDKARIKYMMVSWD